MIPESKVREVKRSGLFAGLGSLRGAVTIRAWNGPLTEELVRNPGNFGLGQVPARLEPDATTTMVCGFCSTGCGLNIHMRDGQAVNLSADTSYPVNLGMACPKGWEALTPLSAPDRGTTPLHNEPAATCPRAQRLGTCVGVVLRAVQGNSGQAWP